jgi:SAM-dependent methyltransferase
MTDPNPAAFATGVDKKQNIETRKLNAGCGRNIIPGWINLDSQKLPGVNVITDLERCAEIPIPLDNDSIDEILLSHVIEHIKSPLPMMQELHRIARPGAKAVIRVPYGSSDDAWEDPTHVRAYFPQSFGYFSQPYYWRADYGYRGDWQPVQITLSLDGKTYSQMSRSVLFETINKKRNVVREMVCILEAIKPARPPQRELQKTPVMNISFF